MGSNTALFRWRSPHCLISFDDFVSQYQKIAEEHVDPVASLNAFIDGVKSRNHPLRFGATIYIIQFALLSEQASSRLQ